LQQRAKFRSSAVGMSRQTLMPGASSKIDAEISRVQNEIKALDRSISAQQQQRNTLSTNLDSLLAAKEKSDMLASSFLLLRIQATYYVAIFLNAFAISPSHNACSPILIFNRCCLQGCSFFQNRRRA
jgi:hypothetical protein